MTNNSFVDLAGREIKQWGRSYCASKCFAGIVSEKKDNLKQQQFATVK